MEHKTEKGTQEYKSALFKHQRDTGHLIDYEICRDHWDESNGTQICWKHQHFKKLILTFYGQKGKEKWHLFNESLITSGHQNPSIILKKVGPKFI